MRRPLEHWIALLLVTATALYVCWLMIEPFVIVLLWAAVLAIVAYPYYQRWRRRGRGASAAAGITTLLIILVVIVPVSLVGLAMVRQAAPAAQALQSSVRELLNPDSRLFQFLDRYLDMDDLRDPEFIAERLQGLSTIIASRTLGLVGGLIGAIVQMVFVLFTLYYLLRDADRIIPALRGFLPLENEEIDEVYGRTREVINASLYGVVVIAAIQGALGGLAFWVLGLPSPLLWGVVMFLFSMIPVAGAFVVWVPAAIFLALTGHWIKATLLAAWGALVIGTIDNFLRPILVGERARLHELIVFFAVLGGLHVFGVLGLVVGPVMVAIALSLLEVLQRAHRKLAEAQQKPGLPVTPIVVPVAMVESQRAPPNPPPNPDHAPAGGAAPAAPAAASAPVPAGPPAAAPRPRPAPATTDPSAR